MEDVDCILCIIVSCGNKELNLESGLFLGNTLYKISYSFSRIFATPIEIVPAFLYSVSVCNLSILVGCVPGRLKYGQVSYT